MEEQQILNGGLNELTKLKEELEGQAAVKEEIRKLQSEVDRFEKKLASEEKAVQEEINAAVNKARTDIVKSFDKEKKRISLTMKNPDENPWDILKANYNVEDVVEATVVKLMPYGAFVSVIPGIDGLVHISQISKERLAKVSDALTVGQKVNAKITDIDFEAQKINLSIKEAAAEEAVEEVS